MLAVVLLVAASGRVVADPLGVNATNPRYLELRGKPIVAVSSGEHYGALLNRNFDYARYFDELADHGLNHSRVFVGSYRETPESFGITDNTLSPSPGAFICPWARSTQPDAWDGGSKFDLSAWDPEYFERLRKLAQAADEREIILEIVLFCPMYEAQIWAVSPWNSQNNVNGIGNFPRTEALSLQHPDLLAIQLEMVRKIVTELNQFECLYFEVCNEPYARDVAMEWQERIIQCISEAEGSLENRHLISLNFANKSKRIQSPNPAVSIYNFHYCVPPDVVQENYALNRVIGENETGFRGRDDFIYRSEGWCMMLAGGGIYNNLDYSFTVQHPRGTFDQYQSPGGGSAALRKQLGVLRAFLERFDFIQMRPSQDLIRDLPQDIAGRLLAEPGRQYALYLQKALPWKPGPKLLNTEGNREVSFALSVPPGEYSAEWISPRTGEVIERYDIRTSSGETEFTSPAFTQDSALTLFRQPD